MLSKYNNGLATHNSMSKGYLHKQTLHGIIIQSFLSLCIKDTAEAPHFLWKSFLPEYSFKTITHYYV